MPDVRVTMPMTEAEALAEPPADFKRSAWEALKFCLPWLRPYVRKLTLVCLADIGLLVLLMIPPWFTTFMIDHALPLKDWGTVARIITWMIVLGLCTQAIQIARDYLYAYVELKIQLDLRNRMYRKVQRLSMHTLDARPVGQMMDRVLIDSDRVGHTIYRIIPTAFLFVQFGLVFAFVSYIDPIVTAIVLFFLIPWTILFHWVTTIGRDIDRRRLYCCEMRDATIQQASSSFALTKALGRERLELRKYGARATAVQRLGNQNYLILVWFEFATQRLIPFLRTTSAYLYLARRVLLGEMTLGMTVPIISYLARMSYPLERIANFYNWVRQTMVSTERMMQIMNVVPDVQQRPDARRVTELRGDVRLEGVTFSRPGRGVVLEDVTLRLEPGTTTALVGPSGAGKSTIISLMLRLHDPDSGSVLVDGADVRELDLDSYLRKIAVVQQETFIFGGSLRDNVRFGKPEATDAEVLMVLERVGLGEWLRGLPDGLDADLASGSGLSTGQRQRIGIARALIADPGFVILDEPTSSLDGTTEREVMEKIEEVFAEKTILLVTHRLHTAARADRIVVLEGGRLIEEGTHDGLLANPSAYAAYVDAYRRLPAEPELIGGAA